MKFVQVNGTPNTEDWRYEICIVIDDRARPNTGSFWVYPTDNHRFTNFELEFVV